MIHKMLSDQIDPYCNSEQSWVFERPKKFYFNLERIDTKSGIPSLPPQPSQEFLYLTDRSLRLRIPQLSNLIRWILNCFLRTVWEIHMIRRLLNLCHNSTVSDMTAIWDKLGLTVDYLFTALLISV